MRQTLHTALQKDAIEEYEHPVEARYRDPPRSEERSEHGERAWGEPGWDDYPDWQDADEQDYSAYSEPTPVPEAGSRPGAVARLA